MSLHQQARQLIDQAETAIKADNPQYAIELLRQSILYNGKDADAYILLGIALAQTRMPADAENAFKKATHLAPDSVKARYNLAVHQYAEGQVRAALNSARRASEMDVRHAGARSLAERIEAELGIQPGEEPKTTAAGNPNPVAIREGYEPQEVQTVPFVERHAALWSVLGWVIAATSLSLAILFTLTVYPAMTHGPSGSDAVVRSLSADPRIGLIRILYFLVNIGGLGYVAVDAIHRRANLLWIVPQVLCGCTGFTFVILPVYMLGGRKS